MSHFIGIEIGATKLQVVLGDGYAQILERRRMGVDLARGVDGIREQIKGAVADLTSRAKADAVGVGFGGPIDIDTGRIAMSYHVDGWHGFELRTWLAGLTGLEVAVDNDTNAGALAEAVLGAGREFRLVLYTNLGSGMGGGFVIDRRIYHGARPGECELGLMRYDLSGKTVESRCSGWAIDARVRDHVAAHPDGLLAELVGDATSGEARALGPALARRDPAAETMLDELTTDLAYALSAAAHLLSPEVIIIGGGLSLLGEPLRAALAGKLPGFITEAYKPGPKVRLSALGEDVVSRGALLLARQSHQAQ
ncbi:MAG: ROK family protein [Planctomycetota bacterium]